MTVMPDGSIVYPTGGTSYPLPNPSPPVTIPPSSGYPAGGATPMPPGTAQDNNPKPPPEDSGKPEIPIINGPPPGSNIRDKVQFNCAVPKMVDAVGYTEPRFGTSHAPLYRKKGMNAKGMIVRDFNMSARLEAANSAWGGTQGNWGFQFHYNPNVIQESFSPPAGMDYLGFIMDVASSPILLVSAQSGALISFEILLLRRDDMNVLNLPNWRDYYPTLDAPTPEDREEILKKGTQYDIEQFFRVVNLDPVQVWRNDELTSDWGMMMATPVIVSLGDSEGCRKFRAQPASLTVQHLMYAPGMIPVYSKLTFSFTRIPDMYAAEGYGDTSTGESAAPDTGGSATDEGPFVPNYPGDVGTGRPKKDIRTDGVVHGTSSYGHFLHRAATQSFPQFDDWATYQSPGNHGNGRALDIHVPVHPKTRANQAWKLAEWLTGTGVSSFGVTQVIFQQQIWTPARSKEGWRDQGDRGGDTQNHFDHIHVSFGPESDNSGAPPGGFKQKLQLYTSKEFWEKNSTPSQTPGTGSAGSQAERNQAIARPMLGRYGWDTVQWNALVTLWHKESGWNERAENKSSGAYGIPQALPGSKMASVDSDWRTNPKTQITWGLGYIKDRYGSPVKALQHSDRNGWY